MKVGKPLLIWQSRNKFDNYWCGVTGKLVTLSSAAACRWLFMMTGNMLAFNEATAICLWHCHGSCLSNDWSVGKLGYGQPFLKYVQQVYDARTLGKNTEFRFFSIGTKMGKKNRARFHIRLFILFIYLQYPLGLEGATEGSVVISKYVARWLYVNLDY